MVGQRLSSALPERVYAGSLLPSYNRGMDLKEFANEPSTDFSRAENRAAMQTALDSVAARLGEQHALVIGGQPDGSPESFCSYNPSHASQVVGVFPRATSTHVDRAVRAAYDAFAGWRRVSAPERSDYLLRAAAALRARKHEWSAWLVYEVGKSWAEADADTNEAIDFCEFYARENLRYAAPQPLTPVAGERSALSYLPLGVVAIIPPWNFPLAILVGMTTAAIVTGNTVVLKPSSDAPTIAGLFCGLMQSLGLPPGVLNLVTGSGAEIGDSLVRHPLVRLVAFTGSKEVGLRINELAAKPQPGQRWIKRVIAEMGGKDAIIVDREADLDQATQGAAAAAFGYQGQKCSACSRLIVDEAVYDDLLARLVARVSQIVVGPAEAAETAMGPVINQRARDGILRYIEVGRSEGRVLTDGAPIGPEDGYYLPPTIIADVAPRARIAQEEIFGPVLAVIKANDFDQALAIANDSDYGLTGAVYTTNREKIAKAEREFFVGNLYFNRKCTGALVGAHPFGGFNLSGTDSKAGGRDYLLLFLQAQARAERVG
jgi:1-pyrroline-5-carboxylate dehydrogenase